MATAYKHDGKFFPEPGAKLVLEAIPGVGRTPCTFVRTKGAAAIVVRECRRSFMGDVLEGRPGIERTHILHGAPKRGRWRSPEGREAVFGGWD